MRTIDFLTGTLLLGLGCAGCDFTWRVVDGSGREVHETREVATFSAVLVKDSLEAEVTLDPDQPQSVEVSGDDNIVPLISSRVTAGQLVIDLPGSFGIHPKVPLIITLRATALTGLEGHDSARVTANRVEGGHVVIAAGDSAEVSVETADAGGSLSISAADSGISRVRGATAKGRVSVVASDSSVVDAESLAAGGKVTVQAEDSSVVTLQGDAPALEATLEDSSHLDAVDLTVASVVVRGSDSSEADVCATGSVHATLSDSSAVLYTCDPETVTHDLDDSSSVTEH